MDKTLVVVNWNNRPLVELCLKSYVLHHYKGEKLNLKLWDNGSKDDSKEWLRNNNIPFYDCPDNLGHEQALNEMYDDINTQYMLLCDTDIEFTGNTDCYFQHFNDKCIAAGDLITGDNLGSPIKQRIGAWFMLFDIKKIKQCGVKSYREGTDWSYDVNSWMTEKIFENGFTHYQINREAGDIDRDLISMRYPTHNHIGKMSWDLNKHADREWEINMRRGYVTRKLDVYKEIDLKDKFI